MAEIRGLDLFGKHFADYREHYVLIGGVASWLTMEEAGLPFRATKDLDIVLVIEALNTDFVAHFWDFIKAGEYQVRQRGGERPLFYRFQNPGNEAYPAQLELFSRSPEGLEHAENATLTPIPTDESISSLSAILLDAPYYEFLLDGRQDNEVVTFIGADRLVPLKAHAWLNLSQRKEDGEQVDSKNIRKHRNDLLHLGGQLTGEAIPLPDRIQDDMSRFLQKLAEEKVDLKAIGLRGTLEEHVARLSLSFGLDLKEN